MRAVPGQEGIYRSEFVAGNPGNYRLALAGDQIASLDFAVRDENLELSRTALNERLLRDLAEQTGGAYFPLGQLDQVASVLNERSVKLTSLREADLWSSPLFLALILLLITTEWIVRKISELK